MTKEEKIIVLEYDIGYEEAPGIHTYHQCPYCKKHSTRSGKCAWCLRKELADVSKIEKQA